MTGASAGGERGKARSVGKAADDRMLRTLRARWRTASLASGWRFPSDWALPEVDAVCAAVLRHGGKGPEQPALPALPALSGLGRARASAGAGLMETLTDVAALHAVLADPEATDGFVAPDVDATPPRLIRVIAVAWADVALDQLVNVEVTDALTGLPTAAYLRTRLGEVYRQAERDDRSAADAHTLLVLTLNAGTEGWTRLTGMILLADVLRSVFDGGETVAVLGPSTIAALVPRDPNLASRAVRLRRGLTERFSVDPQLHALGEPKIRIVRLPATHDDALTTLAKLSHA